MTPDVGSAAFALRRDRRGVVIHSAGTGALLDNWLANVVHHWREEWEGKDHRYGHDFAAFLGERFLTDFDRREAVPRGWPNA